MTATLWPIGLFACTAPKLPPLPTVDGTSRPGETGETGATGHTGSTETADTGDGFETFVDPYLEVQPSVRLIGTPGMDLGHSGVSILPAFGSDPALLVIESHADPLYLQSFLLSGTSLGRGDQGVVAVWDGVSYTDYRIGDVPPSAGDVNDDGHLDAWLGADLFLGPFLGRHVAFGGGIATIYGGVNPKFGDIDADGDGNEDMVADIDCCQTAYLFYGPFSGTIAAPFAPYPDPTTTTFTGTGCVDAHNAVLLRDNLGPGHHAVAVGEVFNNTCSNNTYVHDLMAPQGSYLDFRDAIGTAFLNGDDWDGIGDIDGDGYGDAVYGSVLGAYVIGGPMHGDAKRDARHIPQVNGSVRRGIGDINGDGIEELLAVWPETLYPLVAKFTILFSPHEQPIDVTDGLVLGDINAVWNATFGDVTGDLDGDGRSDLVGDVPWTDNRGAVQIWYGADLLAAEEARVAALPTPP